MRPSHESPAHFRSCNLCEAIIRGDKDDPFSLGYICPKAVALKDIHYDKDRLKHPVRRTPHGWQRIGWNEAFDEVVDALCGTAAFNGKPVRVESQVTAQEANTAEF